MKRLVNKAGAGDALRSLVDISVPDVRLHAEYLILLRRGTLDEDHIICLPLACEV